MSLLIQYLIKLSVSLGVVWLFYFLFLRRLTFYNWNRLFLVGYSLIAFCIPFIDISPVLEKSELSANKMVQFIPMVHTLSGVDKELSMGVWDWILIVLAAGCVLFLVRLIIRHLSFLKLKRSASLVLDTPVKLYQIDKDIMPFSFGDSIFINRHQHGEEDFARIIRHEFVHVKQKHSLDILWAEWLCVLNWYNPFAWLIRNAIRQNLEFIADNSVVQNGIDKKQYQYLLLKVLGTPQYRIAANFNFNSLKIRIAMMNKMKTARVHLINFLFVLPLIGILLLSFRDTISREVKQPGYSREAFFRDTIPGRPALPQKPVLPKNVRSFVTVNNQLKVTLKDGTVEKYNLDNPEEKALFTKRFGSLPEPPAPPEPMVAIGIVPPTPPTPPSIPAKISSVDIDNNKATIKHKNGEVESYDLNKPEEKKIFEQKYKGVVPAAPKPPTAPKAAVSISTMTVVGVEPAIAAPATVALPPAKIATTIELEPVIATPVAVALSSVNVATTLSADVIELQPTLQGISNWEKDEIIAEITKRITATEMSLKKRELLARGYTLEITKANYANGILQSVEGTIADGESKSRFIADDFSKLVISKVRYKDGKSGFNIRIHNGTIRL